LSDAVPVQLGMKAVDLCIQFDVDFSDASSGCFAVRFGGRCSIEGEGRGRWEEIGSEKVEASILE
jgi:hypothetical protein